MAKSLTKKEVRILDKFLKTEEGIAMLTKTIDAEIEKQLIKIKNEPEGEKQPWEKPEDWWKGR